MLSVFILNSKFICPQSKQSTNCGLRAAILQPQESGCENVRNASSASEYVVT